MAIKFLSARANDKIIVSIHDDFVTALNACDLHNEVRPHQKTLVVESDDLFYKKLKIGVEAISKKEYQCRNEFDSVIKKYKEEIGKIGVFHRWSYSTEHEKYALLRMRTHEFECEGKAWEDCIRNGLDNLYANYPETKPSL